MGDKNDRIIFSVFSDFHYKKGMYASEISDIEKILERAKDNGADFVLSAGDFCNDYLGSPELINAFLNNRHGLPVYNVYGNHELESKGNSMSVVTPLLTNDANIVLGQGAYYYFDKKCFRIICLDTNFSYNEANEEWQHNVTNSFGPPPENKRYNSLGDVQLKWLEKVVFDAADKGLKCIVLSHVGFSGKFGWDSPDAEAVRALFRHANEKATGTVLLGISGHIHTNHVAVTEDVLYIDVNTVRNGFWLPKPEKHYSDNHTFMYVDYDSDGKVKNSRIMRYNELSASGHTWFFSEPLSAIVTLDKDGKVVIEGMETEWAYGVVPDTNKHGKEPRIASGKWELHK
ncbi:MAG: metallophosphoesterase [Clostridia bacterium]|nr:metallophosphoesterase [Clostridia bacterium]